MSASSDLPPPSPNRYWIGLLALVVAAGASLLLVIKHHTGVSLPGCGPDSACAALAKSVWGRVPGIDLPTAHLGLAYFTALLAAYLIGGAVPRRARWIVFTGALVSIVLVVVMLTKEICGWCMAVHVANFVFVIAALGAAATWRRPTSFGPALGGVGAVALFTLVMISVGHDRAETDRAEQALADSTDEIIERTAAAPGEDASAVVGESPDGPADPGPPFTGRYRLGPEDAPIRLVLFSDFQCRDCRTIEMEVRQLVAGRDDISVSMKHYPFCKDCNDKAAARNFNPHPNACWGARAAEAAGMLDGNDGFWRMHEWLFDRGGGFTDAELNDGLAELGFDRAAFLQAMTGPETLELVRADIAEGEALGLFFTPMIFINGVELRGWTVRNALTRAVEQVAASNPPRATAINDQPVEAEAKYVGDWLDNGVRPFDLGGRVPYGAGDDAAVEVIVWGDYLESGTQTLDTLVRQAADRDGDVSYIFRSYPFDQACNPHVPRTQHAGACRASQIAEAARYLYDPDTYWRVHAWLMTGPALDDARILAFAATEGLDGAELLHTMSSGEVASMITADVTEGKRLRQRSLPFIFVNGRLLPRWRMNDDPILDLVIAEARK